MGVWFFFEDMGIVEFMSMEEVGSTIGGDSFPFPIAQMEFHALESGGLMQNICHRVVLSVHSNNNGAEVHHSSTFSKTASAIFNEVADAFKHGMIGTELRKKEFWIASREIEKVGGRRNLFVG